MDKILARRNKQNKDKHGNNCHEKWESFTPFVLSVDGMFGKEAMVVLANLSQLMLSKMEESISHV